MGKKKHIVKVKSITALNHDVLEIVTEKPVNYDFRPGQATEMAINKKGWEDENRPFTFSNLPGEDHLEFVIKTYPSHDGMTDELLSVKVGDELILHEVFGAIEYKGKGAFLAGGSGVTPFISIFKSLEAKKELSGNSLVFANKKKEDIFLKDAFESMLGSNYINLLSDESTEEYLKGHIDKYFLQKTFTDFNQYFYLCGPPEMTDEITIDLKDLGVPEKKIVVEEY
ncbi:flavodoxin reductase [Maribacter sp.]|nr:flavodoxin reductase [Maribacter sp.]